ncbi:MAG: hypothetical protein IJX55_03190 [Clostridia bacterium]|nr:hypothetical protein [Clostridia bacterium]
MKKRFLCAAALLLALVFTLSACGGKDIAVELVEETAWAVYELDEAPVKIVEAGGVWYALMGRYGSDDFRLAVGESYEYFDTVYETENVTIWFFEANENYAVWCERSGNICEFKVYTRATGEVSTVRTLGGEDGYQNANVGLFGDSLYFLETDYAAEKAAVMRYDAKTGELSRFYEFTYDGEYSAMNLSLAGDILLAVGNVGGKASLVRFDLAAGGAPDVRELSKKAEYVFDAAYDTVTGAYAIYYKDTDGAEHIGVISAKSNAVANIFTFAENVYAYEDTVRMHDSRVYWITQVNASGFVTEHYRFIDYDYKSHTRTEYLRTFGFTVAEDGVYLLSFNKEDYDGVYLSKIFLGGKKQ